ncbi:hypothetical protein ASZ90_007014 [hydrocarbon metagenome]|uniref:Uncharacterized protein n=1 Tax=hydrocarbon metagenome TaxID=938273 RepID=A0A0W8FQH0_9ZZZZ
MFFYFIIKFLAHFFFIFKREFRKTSACPEQHDKNDNYKTNMLILDKFTHKKFFKEYILIF